MSRAAPRWRRPGILLPAVLGAVGVALLLRGIWHFADALVWAPPVRRRMPPTRVLGLDPGGGHPVVRLTRNAATTRAGVLGVEWNDASGAPLLAQLGPVLQQDAGSVSRAVQWQQGTLGRDQWVRPSTIGVGTPASRGLTYEEVSVPAQHGAMPAWQVPGDPYQNRAGDWVILTHGFHGLRQDALRILPTFARLGLTSLVITFRNAHGAPRTREGVYSLSAHEWQDLEAAVQYARSQGARRLLLMGFSMGGGITLAFLRYSPLNSLVSAVILDSPALEWRSLIRLYARRYRLLPLASTVERLTVLKSGQDFDAVDHLNAAAHFQTPMLLIHGTEDRKVPVAQAEQFARARPDLVEYHRFEGAEHVRSWNLDPARYEQLVTVFVDRVLG